jgi:hypothetical protein
MTPSCCDCKRAFEPDEPVYRMRWRRAASGRAPGRVSPNLCASCAGADNPRPRHHWGWGDDWVTRTSCLECDRPIYQRERHTRFCSHACLMTHQISARRSFAKSDATRRVAANTATKSSRPCTRMLALAALAAESRSTAAVLPSRAENDVTHRMKLVSVSRSVRGHTGQRNDRKRDSEYGDIRDLHLISVSIKLRLNPLLQFVILESRSQNAAFA